MNLKVFDIPDISGRMSKKSFLIKNYIEEYEYIIKYCIDNNINDIPFKEKVYLSINLLKSVPSCRNSICNNNVKYKNSTIGYLNYCSNRCVSSDSNIKNKKKESSFKRYGTKTPAESKEIKDKIIKTNNEKYGGNSPMSNKEIQDKSKLTLLENYGVDNPGKSVELLTKRIKSFRLSNYKNSFKNISILKYGVNHPWMVKDIHMKTVVSTAISKNDNLLNKVLKQLESYKEYKLVDIDYNIFKRNIVIFCSKCKNNFEINREDFYIRQKNKTVICKNCNPVNTSSSGTEMELYNYIRTIYNNGVILTNSKLEIYPYELDIYLPDINIAFEYNGLYWHSEQQKGKYYHQMKTKMCSNIGINLVHIWEDDWVYKNEIIKSIILNKLMCNTSKIFARKCNIRNVSIDEQIKFLNENHILGYVKSTIKIGLFYDNKLVSLMCFLKRNNVYELTRFCNILNSTVIGGSSKLFKYFLKENSPKIVISYSDNSMYKGDLYIKLGFLFDRESPVNYKWVLQKIRTHKSNYRKGRLIKLGYDINKSENEIMVEDIGSYKIWDCGLKKWTWRI